MASVTMKKITWKSNLILIITCIKQTAKIHNITIIIRSVFEEDGKLYPQVLLNDTLHELNV